MTPAGESTGPSPRWLVLSGDRPLPAAPAGATVSQDALAAGGTLVLGVAGGLRAPAVLLDLRGGDGGTCFSILADPVSGVSVLHRAAARAVQHRLGGRLPLAAGGVEIVFQWDNRRSNWTLSAAGRDGVLGLRRSGGRGALPIGHDVARALCSGRGAAWQHPLVEWCGVMAGTEPLVSGVPDFGLCARAPVETPTGRVMACQLRPGDAVLTMDRGVRRIVAARRHELPCRGERAPVILRAGHFAIRSDLAVAPGQPVAFSGSVVEYLFGRERVLVRGRDIRLPPLTGRVLDGRVAQMVQLTLDAPALLRCGGLSLLAAGGEGEQAHTPPDQLRAYEVAALVAALGGGGRAG